MKQKIVKKGLGILMAGALVFSVMPGVAMADEVVAEPEADIVQEEFPDEIVEDEIVEDEIVEDEIVEDEIVEDEIIEEEIADEDVLENATENEIDEAEIGEEDLDGEDEESEDEDEEDDEFGIAALAATNDITETIQQEIDSGETYIEIPAGTWYCSGLKLNDVSNLTISAAGATIIQSDGTQPLLYVQDSHTASNIVIIGGTWDGNGYALPVMRFYGSASNITIQDAAVINTSDRGIRFKSTNGVYLSNVTVSNHANDGVRFESVADATVTGSTIADNDIGLNFVDCAGDNYVIESSVTGNASSGVRTDGTASITLNYNEMCFVNKKSLLSEVKFPVFVS